MNTKIWTSFYENSGLFGNFIRQIICDWDFIGEATQNVMLLLGWIGHISDITYVCHWGILVSFWAVMITLCTSEIDDNLNFHQDL